MCGIAGIAGNFRRDQGVSDVGVMIHNLARRGPDGEGAEVWHEAVLGHRRLAIFDLSELGHQPMMSPNRGVGIVFNGAIYNFRDLRLELESKGYKFRSHTDTEVLIHGYDAWGIDELVSRIRGMFAFALWDDRKRRLYLVRDRLGVKPLVYAVGNGSLAFASTVRALHAAGFVREIDEEAVTEFLEFGYVTDDRAIYRGAVKVPAATIVEWSGGSISSRVYWNLPSPNGHAAAPSFAEAVEETERLLVRAVEKRLFADVPVGALLSGGVDSSLVCWAVAKLGGNVTSFTVGTSGDTSDETEDARATAARLGISHRVLDLSADDSPSMDEMVSAYAEPFACASALGMLRVSRAVAPEAKVLLTGDGGDDVFLGYPEHRNFWLAQRFARKLPAGAASLWLSARNSFPRRGISKRAASFLDYACGGLGAVACAHDGLPMYEKNGFLGERLAGKQVVQRTIPWTSESARHLLEEFLEYDRATRFVGEYMTKVDGATMHHALEARSPFLDQELWEFAASLPFDLRLRHGRSKAVLRELAAHKLGERVARGPKRGFSIPVQRWLAGRWRSDLTNLLQESLLEREGWIHSGPVLSRLETAAHEGWAPNQLWYIFVLESWLRQEQDQINSRLPITQAILSDKGGQNRSPTQNSSISDREAALLPTLRP